MNKGLPFSAIVGQEKAKKALLCAITSPDIRSVLLIGGSGVGKSTLVRSVVNLFPHIRSVVVPLNATEERLTGSMDLELALSTGEVRLVPGLLGEADKNILVVDQMNLLDETIINTIMEANSSRHYVFEREGISGSFPCDFLIIATMNPEEGEISPHVLDRFDLCVELDRIIDPEERRRVLMNSYGFERAPDTFTDQCFEEERILENVLAANRIIPYVFVSEGHYELITRLSMDLGVQGHRGDISLLNVSRALAALDGRDSVLIKDLQEGASLCLEHRRTQSTDPPLDQCVPEQSVNEDTPGPDGEDRDMGTADYEGGKEEDRTPHNTPPQDNGVPGLPSDDQEMVFGIGSPFIVIDFLGKDERARKRCSRNLGRREEMISKNRSGRYVAFQFPKGKVHDLALDASLRAAAPFQRTRDKGGLAIRLLQSDLREKIRVRRKGTTLLFVVDGSGSMGVKQRMSAVKGAIFSLLDDAYKKRDAVGMMVFRGDSAEMLLPPTRSIDLAYKKLQELPTGGRTPLPVGLSKAVDFINSWTMRYPEEDPVVVLVSDGRANVSTSGGNPVKESILIAENASHEGIRFIVVDTETGFPRMNLAKNLCMALRGSYFKLEELDADFLARSVRAAMNE